MAAHTHIPAVLGRWRSRGSEAKLSYVVETHLGCKRSCLKEKKGRDRKRSRKKEEWRAWEKREEELKRRSSLFPITYAGICHAISYSWPNIM